MSGKPVSTTTTSATSDPPTASAHRALAFILFNLDFRFNGFRRRPNPILSPLPDVRPQYQSPPRPPPSISLPRIPSKYGYLQAASLFVTRHSKIVNWTSCTLGSTAVMNGFGSKKHPLTRLHHTSYTDHDMSGRAIASWFLIKSQVKVS